MQDPAVSVVIPFHNRAASLLDAVRSVLDQSLADLELILVDDASTDGSAGVLAGLDDPRLRLLRHEVNQGASAARNTGINAARAPWVAFQDSDDIWFPDKLALQMARLAESPADTCAAYCGMWIEDLSGSTRPPRYLPDPSIVPREGRILDSLIRQSFISTQTLVVRRDLALEVGGFDPEMPALVDWEFMLRLAQTGPVALVDKPLVQQRFSDNSLTRSAARRLKARQRILDKHEGLLARDPAALAGHHNAIAGALRRQGGAEALRAAADHLRKAIRLDPGRLHYRLALARLRLDRILPGRG